MIIIKRPKPAGFQPPTPLEILKPQFAKRSDLSISDTRWTQVVRMMYVWMDG